MSSPDSLPCPPRRTIPASSQRPRTEPRLPLGDFFPSEPRHTCRQPADCIDCGSTHRRWPRASRAWGLARPALDAAAGRWPASSRCRSRASRALAASELANAKIARSNAVACWPKLVSGPRTLRVEVRRQSRAESASNGPSGAVDAVAVSQLAESPRFRRRKGTEHSGAGGSVGMPAANAANRKHAKLVLSVA
jgi:hypothetical protein